ncbi:GWT1-domain-containing protein [Paraphysoderma sedebokerense]|nr:GWT1-domain-containing protein [Paraphysoderma sedebokerense]
MDSEYKRIKEERVKGLTGSSASEINLIISIGIFSCYIHKLIHNRFPDLAKGPHYLKFLIDFVVLVLPLIITICIPSYTEIPLIILSLFIIYISNPSTESTPNISRRQSPRLSRNQRQVELKDDERELLTQLQSKTEKPFVTVYKAYIMVMTIVCILAVDFDIFPRRFAKTETYGTSLMDVGVGCFVFSMAVSSGMKLHDYHSSLSPSSTSNASIITRSIKKTIPLWILGLIRLATVKVSNYQEHETEYGIHWNFFFTLAMLPVALSVCRLLYSYIGYVWMGGIVSIVYQLSLQFGLTDYILNAPRDNLISMNREGILSFFGYTSILLHGVEIGMEIAKPRSFKQWESTPALLGRYAVAYGLSYFVAVHVLGIPVSRRMANLSFIYWIATFNTVVIIAFLAVELAVKNSYTPLIFRAVNQAQLATFLIANVFTGLINMSINTLTTSAFNSFLVITMYTIVVTGISVILYLRGWVLRI